MLCHQLERESRHNPWRSGGKDIRVGFADKRNVPHGEVPLFGGEVEIVQAESLLKYCWVFTSRKSKHYRIDVAHVVAPDLTRAVRKTVWMPVIRRTEHQCCRI